MTTNEVRIWHEWSDWLFPQAQSGSIECIAAGMPAVPYESRRSRAAELGAALAEAVAREMAIPQVWLLVASRANFAFHSKSGTLRSRRRGLVELEQAAQLGLDLSSRIDFEISEEGTWGRLAAAIPLAASQWGIAIRLMLDVPAVGVVIVPGLAPQEVLPRVGSEALAGEGAQALHSRAFHLEGLFAAEDCIGVLTATGVFDDPELVAEYHYRHDTHTGAGSELRPASST